MNERIKELILRTDAWCDQNFPANWTDDVDQYLPLWNAKFAELIVRECLDVCDTGYKNEFTIAGIQQCTYRMKEHFGVE